MPTTELDCTWKVNEVIRRHPATIDVFNRFGLDTCCGSGLSVEEAARANGVERTVLCAELHAAVDG